MLKQRWFERLRPPLAGAAGTLAYVLMCHNRDFPTSTRDLFPATLNISAITIGFMATAKSIMFSVGDTRRIRLLKQHGSYYHLVDSLVSAINWSFLLALASAACLLVDLKWHYSWTFIGGWLFCAIVAGVWFYQVIHAFASILRSKDN